MNLSFPSLKNRRRYLQSVAAMLFGWHYSAALSQATERRPKTQKKLLILGDSLSAEYGLKRGTGWVALLTHRMQQTHPSFQVVNASISGDTTAGGRSRLSALLQQNQPSHVMIELGGNDALRGLPLQQTTANLKYMIQTTKDHGCQVILVGMQVPPNYGQAYTQQFENMFQQISKEQKVPLVPFLLKGVADGPNAYELFQADRIHPNEAAQPIILENVWKRLVYQL
jgi:acyl-CoA thioesterase-1